jgi:hypothetical protein
MQRVGVSEEPPVTSGAGRPSWVGTWGIWGGESYKFPWLKGSVLTCRWASIETNSDNFNFACIDNAIATALSNNQTVMILVYIDHPPAWVWDTVPMVETVDGGTYPYYLDAEFKSYVKRMWAAVLKHVANLPESQRKYIIGMQVPLGKSGDEQPYDSAPRDDRYAIDDNGVAWGAYQKEMILAWVNARTAAGISILPMFKVQGVNYDWMKEQGIHHMRKTVMVAQMYQMNGEMNLDWVRKDLFEPIGDDYTRARGEFDAPVAANAGWLLEAPLWNYYWQSLWMLTYGVDMFNQRTQTLSKGNANEYAFTFFTNHAGYKNPKTSRYAFVALRDALDQGDTARFPEAQFGAFNGADSPTRYQKIAAAFAQYGAKQGDALNQAKMTLQLSTALNALNDVGFKIWPGNYGKYLDQINPNGTSQGYWRVGPLTQPYGRYARGFNIGKGMNRMYFNVDNTMFDTSGLAGKEQIQVRVVYFDKGVGAWALHYDATGNADKQAYLMTNTNTNTWKEKTATITDANFNNRGPLKSDISLVNTDSIDEIFHMIEITFTER